MNSPEENKIIQLFGMLQKAGLLAKNAPSPDMRKLCIIIELEGYTFTARVTHVPQGHEERMVLGWSLHCGEAFVGTGPSKWVVEKLQTARAMIEKAEELADSDDARIRETRLAMRTAYSRRQEKR